MIKNIVYTIFITIFIPFIAYANNIRTSILPLQSFVSMITEGTITKNENYPQLILKNNSPHDIELTFSQIKEIKNADIIFIVSRNLETPFIKHVDSKKTKLIVIDEMQDLNLYKFDNSGFSNYINDSKHDKHDKNKAVHKHKNNHTHTNDNKHEHEHEHEHENNHDDHHNHSHDSNINDYHVWLDPMRAKIILQNITRELSKIYPENAVAYNNNLKKYSQKLDQLNNNIKKDLKNFNKNTIFFHNGWQYFVKTYNIHYFGTIINHEVGHSHGINMSAKSYIDLNNYIQKNNIKCIFSEPEFDSSSIEKLTKNNDFKIALLQPIESYNLKKFKNEKDYIEIYFELMQYNSKTIANCFN